MEHSLIFEMNNRTKHINDTRTNDQWNQEIVVKLVPLYVVTMFYLITGVFGNSTVLFIYFKKFKKYSDGRFFIPILAVLDMITCIVHPIGNASETLVSVIYKIDIACKIEKYLRMITVAASMFTLVLIVIDRYLKVCRPFGRQMTKGCKKKFLVMVIFIGMTISAPCFLFYGSAEVTSEGGTIIG